MSNAKPVVLPTLPTAATQGKVSGVVVGVVPHLQPDLKDLEVMRGHTGQLRLSGARLPRELETLLKKDEVMYVVVGKWPPDTIGLSLPAAGSSDSMRRLLRTIDAVPDMNLVIGPYPPEETNAGGQKICGCCKRPL